MLGPRCVAPPYSIMGGDPAVVLGDTSLLAEALAPVEGALQTVAAAEAAAGSR